MSEMIETFEEQEEWTAEDEDRFNGEEAGVVFAQRHVMDKVNLFIEEYRRNNFSEAFIEGFVSGVNSGLGSNMSIGEESLTEESDTEAVDNQQ